VEPCTHKASPAEADGPQPPWAWERQAGCDGLTLRGIISCSDREAIDHLQGDSLIEKVSIDKKH
jgi:hypothetical protein